MKKQFLMILTGLVMIPSFSMAGERSVAGQVAAGAGRVVVGGLAGCSGGAALGVAVNLIGAKGDLFPAMIEGGIQGCRIGAVAGAGAGVIMSIDNAASAHEIEAIQSEEALNSEE